MKHKFNYGKFLEWLIFAIIMLAPFIAVLTECQVLTKNPNAIEGYAGTPTEVFYNAVDNLSSKTLFNWTMNTSLYTAVNTMITELEMNNVISLLLTYWLLEGIVFFIIHIVISLISYMCNFGKKKE